MYLISHEKYHTYLIPLTVSDIENSLSICGIVLKEKKKRRNGIKKDGLNGATLVTSIGKETRGSDSVL